MGSQISVTQIARHQIITTRKKARMIVSAFMVMNGDGGRIGAKSASIWGILWKQCWVSADCRAVGNSAARDY
jgi:hypothetical protein